MQDWRKRVDELRAMPTDYGKPMGIWKIDGILRGELERRQITPYTQTELRAYLEIGAAGKSLEHEPFSSLEQTPGKIIPPPLEQKVSRGAYDRAADAFFDFLEKRVSRLEQAPQVSSLGSLERYALISDIHAPWHDEEAVARVVDEARVEGCSRLIIGGDGFDFYRLSRYAKSKLIRFEEELARARVLLEYLSSQFLEVRVIGGNHDIGRWARVLAEQISEEIRFLVKSPMDVLLADLENVSLVGHTAPFGNEVGWLYQLGEDAIITHCEVSSAQQGVNLEKLKQWIREWAPVLELTRTPRLITTGHTHRLTEHHEHDCLLLETGTLASWDAQAYQFEQAALKNRKPGVKGWSIIHQENGVSNLRESRAIRLRA